MSATEQPGYDPRLEWGPQGAGVLAGSCPVLVVVDVLRFTTAVEVAVGGGVLVAPRPWPAGPADLLSPVAMLGVPAGARVALASPNGATVALAAAGAGAVVLAGCLRNASAVAAAARGFGGPVGVVAAGERRPDGGLRPAVEDLVGAGAVLWALGGRPSPEARAAVAAFLDAAADLPALLAGCASGRELAARGRAVDLPLAAAHDVSRVVPVLRGGAFAQLSWPG
jgi:2-phosphosulfolactate phosphatase